MASIRKEVSLSRDPDAVWDAFADVGQVHTRLAPGFVTDCRLEEGARVVTFFNGYVARELIVDVDPARRRLAYSVAGGQASHHHATFEVLADAHGSRVVWTADVLPAEVAPVFDMMMSQGVEAMSRALQTPNSTHSG